MFPFRRVVFGLIRRISDLYYAVRYAIYDKIRFRKKILFEKPLGFIFGCAVVAVFPGKGKHISRDLMDAISTLKQYGIAVVLVSNSKLHEDDVYELRNSCIAVIEQTNIGRDFGAYKTGYEYVRDTFSSWLNDLAHGPKKKIIFMNDSVIYFPTRFGRMVESILKEDCDFFGATESYEKGWHINSNFFGFSKRSFMYAPVESYWRRYRRVSSRFYAIRHGEIGLSQMIIERGYTTFVSFGILEITKLLLKDDLNSEDFAFISPRSQKDLIVTYPRNVLGISPEAVDLGYRIKDINLTVLHTCLSTRSLIHHFNLLILKYMEFPFLKRDIVMKDLYEPTLVEYALEGMVYRDADFKKYHAQVLAVIGSRNTMRWLPFFHRLLLSAGFR